MLAKTPAEAVEALIAPLRQAAGCVTRSLLVGTGHRASRRPHQATFAPLGDPVRLRGSQDLHLTVNHYYEIGEERGQTGRSWSVTTVGYTYALEDARGRELLVYHWHPSSNSPVTYPHLHVPATAPLDLSKAHLPTGGPVSLAAVVRLAIADLGVAPLRPDWRAVLAAAEQDPAPG